MKTVAQILVGLVAALHVGFMALEMFLWKGPWGAKLILEMDETAAGLTAPIAQNQGLYNGFIAAGLVWSLLAGERGFGLKVFFLACVIIAGAFGAITLAKPLFLAAQSAPAAAALAAVWLAQRKPALH